jgi:hypothetical protein
VDPRFFAAWIVRLSAPRAESLRRNVWVHSQKTIGNDQRTLRVSRMRSRAIRHPAHEPLPIERFDCVDLIVAQPAGEPEVARKRAIVIQQ